MEKPLNESTSSTVKPRTTSRLQGKIVAAVLIPLLLVMSLLAGVCTWVLVSHTEKERIEKLQAVLEIVTSQISDYQKQVVDGVLDDVSAKYFVLESLAKMDFDNHDLQVWVQDTRGRVFMKEGKVYLDHNDLGTAQAPIDHSEETSTDGKKNYRMIAEGVSQKKVNGRIDFINPAETSGNTSSFVLLYHTFPDWGWGVAASTKTDSFTQGLIPIILRLTLPTLLSCFGIACIVVFLIRTSVVKPVLSLREMLKKAEAGDYSVQIQVKSQDEIGDLMESFNKMVRKVESNIELREKQVKHEADLEATEAVQKTLLGEQSQVEHTEIASYFQAAETMGGDWYRYYHHPTQPVLYCFCGDVTGHGLASALITGVAAGSIQSSMHSYFSRGDYSAECNSKVLENVLQDLNSAILSTGSTQGLVMTMVGLAINLETGKVQLVNAGHNWPMVLRENGIRFVGKAGPRLGWNTQISFKPKHFQLTPGDVLILYTDGLIENGAELCCAKTTKMIKKLISNKRDDSVETLCDFIIDTVQGTWTKESAEDDVSLLVIKWKPNQQEILKKVV